MATAPTQYILVAGPNGVAYPALAYKDSNGALAVPTTPWYLTAAGLLVPAPIDASGNPQMSLAGRLPAIPASTNVVAAGMFVSNYAQTAQANVANNVGDGWTPDGEMQADAMTFGFNGSTWDRVRVSNGVAHTTNASVGSAGSMTVWTPATGKRFRLLFAVVGSSVAGHLIVTDGGTSIIDVLVPANQSLALILPSNGVLSAASGNVLGVTNGTGSTASLYASAIGTEE